MRLTILLLFIACSLQGQWVKTNVVYGTTEAGTPAPDSLIAYYRFENDATDEQGNYDGTAQNGIGYTANEYEGSYALNADGGDDGVSIGTINLGDEFTISMHVNDQGQTNTGTWCLFANRASTSGANGFAIWLNSWATNDGKVRVYTGDGTNQDDASSYSGYINSNQYNHVVVIYDEALGEGSTWKIYVNGTDRTSDSNTQIDFSTNQSCVIANFTGYNYSFIGYTDALKIFDIALSGSSLTSLLGE